MSAHGHALELLVPAVNFDSNSSALPADEYELKPVGTGASRVSEQQIGTQDELTTIERIDTSDFGREGEAGASELPPVDGGRQAWLFVGASLVLEMTVWGWYFTWGIIQVYLRSHTPFTDAPLNTVSAVGTTGLALLYIAPGIVIIVLQRYADWERPLMWSAVGLSCGSMLLSSFATKMWQLLVLQGLVCGAAGAVIYSVVLIHINSWFVVKRGTASGIVFAGTGVGGFVFPYFIEACLHRFGFPWTCRIWALLTLVCFSGSIYVARARIPPPRRKRGDPRGPWMPADLSFLRSPLVILMSATTFFASLSSFPVGLYLPAYTESLPHATSLSSSTVLAVYNAMGFFSQMGIGFLSDKYSYSLIVAGIGIFSSLIAFFAWGFADSLGATFAFAVLFGLCSGIVSSWSAVARDVAANNSHACSLIFCTFSLYRGIASILGPQIAAGLYHPPTGAISTDRRLWGKYGFSAVIIFVGTMALISAVGATGLGAAARRKKMQ